MKVVNMTNSSGREVPNQFIIYDGDRIIFQSYDSTIAIKYNDGTVELGLHWDYSTTTGNYRNMFLGETKKETLKKIKSGKYLINEKL